MISDEEWIEKFREQVRDVMNGMVLFAEISDVMIPFIEKQLGDPIKNEKQIRLLLGNHGGHVRIGSPRGTNRGNDVVGTGRLVAWSCENDKCTENHCTQCGHCEARAGDGHTPWYALDAPACQPKPKS